MSTIALAEISIVQVLLMRSSLKDPGAVRKGAVDGSRAKKKRGSICQMFKWALVNRAMNLGRRPR